MIHRDKKKLIYNKFKNHIKHKFKNLQQNKIGKNTHIIKNNLKPETAKPTMQLIGMQSD